MLSLLPRKLHQYVGLKHLQTFLVAGLLLCSLGSSLAGCGKAAPTVPTIEADALRHELGTVAFESGTVNDQFTLTNRGQKPLVIHKVEASCGCTTADLDKDTLATGESTQLDVKLDTQLKLGPVEKTIDVFSNDPNKPKLTLTLLADVVASPMKGHSAEVNGMVAASAKNPLALFQGDCKRCHVDRGLGKTGQALFVADCAMCHGVKAEGGVAPGLLSGDYTKQSHVDYIRGVIANGAANNPSMPGFSKANEGPLSESQIDSLVKYLSYLSKTTTE